MEVGYNHHHGYETETHRPTSAQCNGGCLLLVLMSVIENYTMAKLKNIFGQKNSKIIGAQFSVGFEYTIPMLIVTQFEWYLQNKIHYPIKT